MVSSRIFWKAYAGFALLIALSSATVWLVIAPRVKAEVREEFERELLGRAQLLERFVTFPVPAAEENALRARLSGLDGGSKGRYTVIALDGRVLADTDADSRRMEPHGDRPEVVEARETGRPGTWVRHSRTVGADFLYLALPVYADGKLSGYVRVSLPITGVEDRLDALAATVALGAGIAAVLSLILGVFLFRMFSAPVVRMTAAAKAISGGDYSQRIATGASDEIGDLSRAIQKMSDQLKERLAGLARESNGLRAILTSMLEGVVAVDTGERVIHLNAVAARILGTSELASAGRRVWELTRIQEVNDALRRVLSDAVRQTREVRLTTAMRERVIELHAAPLKGDGGEVTGAVLVLLDVTELRRLEEVRSEFVANVSHELKTPLTAIRGFIETLLDDAEMDEETRRRFLDRAREQTLRIGALVSDLLVLARVEAEEDALDRIRMDLRRPVRESCRRLSPDVTGRTIRFACEVPEEPVEVLGDEEGLRQVVDNLLDNAFKYTSDEGLVRIEVRTEGDRAVIEVADTGLGMERHHVDRIFERFYRVDKARSRALGGTGLGLAIVKHIVSAHGGQVSVETAPGKGSTFHVSLPLLQGETPPDSAQV